MRPEAQATFEPRPPFDLDLTLAPLSSGPSLRHHDGATWRASRTPDGPATVQLKQRGRSVEVSGWGPGAEWAVSHAPELCGQADDDTGFAPAHPLIKRLHHEIRGIRLPRTRSVFEAVVPAVILQQVTTEEAVDSYRHLVNALGEPAPGIGPWTAAKVATVALGDPDAVPVGDYHLPHSIGYAFEGTPRSTDERMLELLEPYRGHRARVIRLITVAGIVAPRFGPRKPLRNFRSY